MSRPYANETFEIEPVGERPWNWQVPFWLLAALAVLVIELNAKPAVGLLILCVRFGFNDWRTARWLSRTDPYPQRGRTIWWFLVGSGFLRIFVVAVLIYPLLYGVLVAIGFKPTRHEVGVSISLGVLGIILSLIVTHIGALLANRRGVKVWINRQLHVARDQNVWPPRLGTPNRLRSMIEATSLPAVVAASLGLMFLLIGMGTKNLQVAMTGSLIAVISGVILINHRLLLRRIMARTPEECWETWRPRARHWTARGAEMEFTEDDVVA